MSNDKTYTIPWEYFVLLKEQWNESRQKKVFDWLKKFMDEKNLERKFVPLESVEVDNSYLLYKCILENKSEEKYYIINYTFPGKKFLDKIIKGEDFSESSIEKCITDKKIRPILEGFLNQEILTSLETSLNVKRASNPKIDLVYDKTINNCCRITKTLSGKILSSFKYKFLEIKENDKKLLQKFMDSKETYTIKEIERICQSNIFNAEFKFRLTDELKSIKNNKWSEVYGNNILRTDTITNLLFHFDTKNINRITKENDVSVGGGGDTNGLITLLELILNLSEPTQNSKKKSKKKSKKNSKKKSKKKSKKINEQNRIGNSHRIY